MSAITTTDQSKGGFLARFKKTKPKRPVSLPTFKENPKLFLLNNINVNVHRLVWTFIGGLVASGVYWLLTQTNAPIHDEWHSMFPDSIVRHYHRAALEGFYGGLLFLFIGYDPWKFKAYKPMGKVERFMVERLGYSSPRDNKPFSPWQLIGHLVALSVVGVILYAAVLQVMDHVLGFNLHHPETAVATTNEHSKTVWSVISYTGRLFIEDYQVKIAGFVAALGSRRLIRGVFDDIQKFLVDRSIAKNAGKPFGKISSVVLPAAFKARYDQDRYDIATALKKFPKWSGYMINAMVVSTILLAVLGFAAINFNLPHVQ